MPLKNSTISRRKLLAGTAALGVGGTAALFFCQGAYANAHASGTNPLSIPPQDLGRLNNGIRSYDLNIQNGETEFLEGLMTPTKGINGAYLGPVLRMNNDEKIAINVTNSLNEQTTLHWHGFNLPASADGGPHQIINPGETWSPQFTVRQKASTMWYHSHLMGKTAEQVWAGIAGMIMIDDAQTADLGLPDTYGIDDIPLALQDRYIRTDGSMPYAPSMHDSMMGMTGDIPMANGTVGAYFDATTSLLRLRLLNASNGSIYSIGFSDGRMFKKIGTDGGLLANPVEVQLITMGPGERADIVVDLSDGQNVTLTHFVRTSQTEVSPEFAFLQIRPTTDAKSSNALPAVLTSLAAPTVSEATNTRQFVLDMQGMMMMGKFTINDAQMDINVINQVVPKDTSEIWEISNRSRMAHPFHVHNTQFRLIDRNGRPAQPHEDGLKDTILVHPGESLRILIRFEHYSDPDLPYMYHCHILEHEDAGMMGQFTVV